MSEVVGNHGGFYTAGARSSVGLHYIQGEMNLQLTQPLWEKLSKDHLKWIRITIALINTVTGIFDACYTGWQPYFWYYSDWCLVLTVATQWGLVIAHFFPFHPGISKVVNFLFQIVLPMELSMTLLYWAFFYSSGSMHLSSTSTYVHPVFLYIVPAILLIIEWSLN